MAHLCGFVRVEDSNLICGLTPHRFRHLSYPLRFLTNLLYEIFTTATLTGDLGRREDSNLRPSGYEPDELPTALPRLVKGNSPIFFGRTV